MSHFPSILRPFISKAKRFFHLTEYVAQQHDRPPQQEERLADIHRRPHLVPDVFR
jgi:hypothetical protein